MQTVANQNEKSKAHPDIAVIRGNRLELGRMLAMDAARVHRAERRARINGRRCRARISTERLTERFGLSNAGYAPMDCIAGNMILGSLNLGGPAKDAMDVALAAIDAVCAESAVE